MAIKQTRPTPDEAYLLLSQGFSADDIAKIAVKGDLDRALTAARKKSGVQPGQEKQFAESESRKGLGELLSTVAPYLAGAGMASLASKLPVGRIAQQVMSVPLAAEGCDSGGKTLRPPNRTPPQSRSVRPRPGPWTLRNCAAVPPAADWAAAG